MLLVKMKKRHTTYVIWKAYSYLLIYMQFKLSNLSTDCPLVEAWGLPSLSTTVDGEVEKLVRRNWPFSLMKNVSFLIK